MDTINLDTLKEIGKPWQKNGKDRIYFNDLATWYGLKCHYYNTGNVSSATLDGDNISNSQAKRILSRLQIAKIWFDVEQGKFLGRDIDQDDFNTIVAAIKATADGALNPALVEAAV